MLVEKNDAGDLRAVGTQLNIIQVRFYTMPVLGL